MAVIQRDRAQPGPLPRAEFGTKPHDALVLRAERWLKSVGCSVVIRDPFRSVNQEQPDAIGWRSGVTVMVECKVSRADFQSDKHKSFRVNPDQGMGDWRFFMCPPEVIRPEDLPNGWGLLWATPKTVRRVHGVPPNSRWYSGAPFRGDRHAESMILVSALRRLTLRGHLPQIYEGPQRNEPKANDPDNWAL